MLGVLITFLFVLGAIGIGLSVLGKLLEGLDPALRYGLAGLCGLGIVGMLIFPIGLVPGGLRWGPWLLGALSIAGLVAIALKRPYPRIKIPVGADALFLLAPTLGAILALIGVVTPSDPLDWDSLAYHLAVPKIWLTAGQIRPITFIHHSNFPFTVDGLYILGLAWGGQSGAKAFSLAFYLLGAVAVFGLTRQLSSTRAAGWSMAAFATVPVVVWESGTAYIDVANGLFAGLGLLFAALAIAAPEARRWMWLCGIFLGLAAGSKYTGLQNIASAGVVWLAACVIRKQPIAPLAIAVGLSLVIAAPWYVKNIVWTGNPVYPFFYSVFGGKNWDSFSDKIYHEQQQTFGAGRAAATSDHPDYTSNPLETARLGASVLGLAYQPGRYTDPDPTHGSGFPFEALGFVALASMLLWMISGAMGAFEASAIAMTVVGLLMWFVLSQQSRYIIGLMLPPLVLAGPAIAKLRAGPLLAIGVVFQGALALFVVDNSFTSNRVPVALGNVTPEQYVESHVPFGKPAAWLNEHVGSGRVALYDEVFGFLLDVPYLWANPGHSTELGYYRLQTGKQLADALRSEGITYVYLNLGLYPPNDPTFQRWVESMGLTGPAKPYTGAEKAQMWTDLRSKWKVLVADAVATGEFIPDQSFGPRIIFRLKP